MRDDEEEGEERGVQWMRGDKTTRTPKTASKMNPTSHNKTH